MELKICGMRDELNIHEIAQLRPNYMGFIFYKNSKRYVGLNFSKTNLIELSTDINKVGVFVNEEIDEILSIQSKYSLDYLQLHGDESPQVCEQLYLLNKKVIKAFAVGKSFDFSVLTAYKPFVNYFLFDTKGKEYGGNGISFDWNLLKNYDGEIPLFLSGGIGLEEIELLNQLDYKKINIQVIDVNSKIEIEPGIKDINKAKLLKLAIDKLA